VRLPPLAPARRVLSWCVLSRRVLSFRVAAALVLVLGYVDLARGGLTIAPLLLVTSYLFLVPLALLAD
jgi:hypothetical protein